MHVVNGTIFKKPGLYIIQKRMCYWQSQHVKQPALFNRLWHSLTEEEVFPTLTLEIILPTCPLKSQKKHWLSTTRRPPLTFLPGLPWMLGIEMYANSLFSFTDRYDSWVPVGFLMKNAYTSFMFSDWIGSLTNYFLPTTTTNKLIDLSFYIFFLFLN